MTQPTGRPAPGGPAKPPGRVPLHGHYTTLTPLETSHSGALYRHLGGEENAALWIWIPESGMPDQAACDAKVASWMSAGDFQVFTIGTGPDASSEPAGIAAYLGVVAEHRRIEIGCIVGKKLQRTRAATEMFFLVIRHAFELGYHRVEWKADNGNKASLAAAERLGFVFEGVFRNHMVVNGKVRDTAWFSITSEDWPAVERGFESWLDESNFDAGGSQIRTLRDCREL